MKWLKHHTDSHASLKVRKLLRNYGVEGYGFYWICNELVAFEGKNYKINKDKDWETTLAELTKFEPKKSREILEFLAEEKFIDKKSLSRGHLHIPKMEDYADDYTKKALKMSGQTPDNVPLKEKKREEIRREEKKPGKYSSYDFLEKIPAKVLSELHERYNASELDIQGKADDLLNYCRAKGREYKNYKAFLENALKKDFGLLTEEKRKERERLEETARIAKAMREGKEIRSPEEKSNIEKLEEMKRRAGLSKEN